MSELKKKKFWLNKSPQIPIRSNLTKRQMPFFRNSYIFHLPLKGNPIFISESIVNNEMV